MGQKFATKDIGEAAAILTSGIEFYGLEPGQGFFWFVFKEEGAKKASGDYWSSKLTVNAKSYFDSLRTLKDRLFAQKDCRSR